MLFALTAMAAVGCESDSDNILSINETGSVSGLVFVDRNANGTLEPQVDGPGVNVSVALVVPASQQAIARTTTNGQGFFIFNDVPVGRYGVLIETPSLGDSLRLASVDSATITVAARDTSSTLVTLGYQQLPISQLGSVAVGRRVIVQGVALNAWSAFGDSTLHVADTSGVIRVIRVAPVTIAAGDTVRLLGTTINHDGAVTIADATAFRVAAAPLTRLPALLTNAQAATAAGGTRANDLVRIDSATIVSTQVLPSGEAAINVDDGTGILQVVLEQSGGFGNQPNIVAGALFDAVGLLVRVNNVWVLKPRGPADISASFQRVTVAQARTMTAGRLVQIEGLALNGWITFGDASVHLVDPTGSLRATEVTNSTLFAGDSVRFVGRIAMRDGQTVLSSVSPTVLLPNRTLPAPITVTTLQARTASGGTLDAALVRIQNATITDTATVAGNLIVGANDSSGRVEIMIRPSLGLLHSQFVPGASISATGLLVPAAGGATWQIRPRAQSDLTITPAPAQLRPHSRL